MATRALQLWNASRYGKMDTEKLGDKHSGMFYQLFTMLVDKSEREKGNFTLKQAFCTLKMFFQTRLPTDTKPLLSSARPVNSCELWWPPQVKHSQKTKLLKDRFCLPHPYSQCSKRWEEKVRESSSPFRTHGNASFPPNVLTATESPWSSERGLETGKFWNTVFFFSITSLSSRKTLTLRHSRSKSRAYGTLNRDLFVGQPSSVPYQLQRKLNEENITTAQGHFSLNFVITF